MRWVSNDPGGSDFTPPGVDVSQTWQDQSSGAFFSPDYPLETRRSVLEHSEVMFWETFPQQHCRRSSGSKGRDAVWPSGTSSACAVQGMLPDTPPVRGDGVKGLLLLSPKVHNRCFADVQLEAVLLTPRGIPLFNPLCENKNEDHLQNPVLSANCSASGSTCCTLALV